MRPINLTVASVTTSNPIPMDIYIAPFNVGFACVVTGTVTYSVQHTYANPFDAAEIAAATWIDHGNVAALTVTADGNYDFPVRAIRLNVTAGTGSVAMTIVQAGVM